MYRIAFILLLLMSCKGQKTQESKQDQVKAQKFDWLVGHWVKTNNEVNEMTYEEWAFSKKGILTGMGYTLSEGDTVFKENMRIIKKRQQWIFEVSQDKDSVTDFIMQETSNSEFICTNSENDFPKNILYRRNDKQLTAEIFNDVNEKIEFHFIPDKNNPQ